MTIDIDYLIMATIDNYIYSTNFLLITYWSLSSKLQNLIIFFIWGWHEGSIPNSAEG